MGLLQWDLNDLDQHAIPAEDPLLLPLAAVFEFCGDRRLSCWAKRTGTLGYTVEKKSSVHVLILEVRLWRFGCL